MSKHSKGYSLIELLVVLSLVAILGTIGVMFFGNILKDSRDQTRVKDLSSLKQALELYRSTNGSYPGNTTFSDDITPKYIAEKPKDPLLKRDYAYDATPSGCTTAAGNCTYFYLCAKKEGSDTYDYPAGCAGLTCDVTTGDCGMGVSRD